MVSPAVLVIVSIISPLRVVHISGHTCMSPGKKIFMTIHVDPWPGFEIQGLFFFRFIGDLEDIFFPFFCPNMKILIPFTGKLSEYAANPEKSFAIFSASVAENRGAWDTIDVMVFSFLLFWRRSNLL